MKQTKKIIIVALVCGLVLSLSSCGSSKKGCPTNFSVEQGI
jgi:hypothetical protein